MEELNQLKSLTTSRDESHAGRDRENDITNEIKLLRQHKTRHESRVKVLEDHNRQLEQQLAKLKQLLEQVRVCLPAWLAACSLCLLFGTLNSLVALIEESRKA